VYHTAAALGVALFAGLLLLIAGQRAAVGNRRYTTVTGQSQTTVMALGRWKWPAFAATALVVVLVVLVPMVMTVMGTFMKLFGFFIEDPWTVEHWQAALKDRLLLRSVQNTLILAFGTAIGGIALHSLIAYVIVRSKFYGRSALDFVSWLPFTVPGILLSLALLTMFLQPVFRPIYGSMLMLIIAGLISGMPLAVQICKGNLLQLGAELEEASQITGANWLQTYTKVVLPLIAPALVTIGLILFIGAARNVATVALLSNSTTRPLSLLQLDYITDGRFEVASVVSCMVVVLTVGVAIAARMLGFRARAG
jgi:iron(III) transport system permease protein